MHINPSEHLQRTDEGIVRSNPAVVTILSMQKLLSQLEMIHDHAKQYVYNDGVLFLIKM